MENMIFGALSMKKMESKTAYDCIYMHEKFDILTW